MSNYNNTFTPSPYDYRKESNIDMMVSNSNININTFSQTIPLQKQSRFTKLIALGNPIVDISAEIGKESVKKYNLSWGGTVFADQFNVGFYNELENMPQVTYIPGGSIQNTLRTTAWVLNMDPIIAKNFKITMLGATGKDNYRDKIINAFNQSGVNFLLEEIPNMQTSRCGVGINQKERCLLPQIRASNCITDDYINEHENEILSHDALLIEGYFLQEKYDLCHSLCDKFKNARKTVILTLSAVFMVVSHTEKILEIANYADIIVGNNEEYEALGESQGLEVKSTFERVIKKFPNKEKLMIMTHGSKGVFIAKYNVKKGGLEYILQSFPSPLKNEEIVDFNGAGDAFLGGFLSQYMQGKNVITCCNAGNDIAGIIIKNIGCTFPKNLKLQFND